jgi:hypothetical protein
MKNSRIVGLEMRKMNHENARGPCRIARSKRRARPRRLARPVERGLDDVDAGEAAVHRQVDARREHRVDEGVGVAEQEIALAARDAAAVRVVAGGMHLRHQLGAGEPLGERGAEGDRVLEELGQRLAARLQVVRPADRADAGDAVGERDLPEPAVVEPEDRDVALEPALEPLRAGEVRVQRRAVVLAVLLLAAELVREQRVAAGRVDEEARAPGALRAVVELGLDGRALGVELDLAHAAAFEGARSFFAALRNSSSSSSERRTCHA